MQEFSSISVSSYEAGSLADRLTEQSRDGWNVVAIVPTGSTVTAYLCREASGDSLATAAVAEPIVAEPTPASEPAPAAEPVVEPVSAPAEIVPTAGSGGTTTADVASSTSTAAAGATTATSTAAAGAAPAGWYADPSSRYELRYWDGGQWTEHVSRAGQQFTDPPVA